VLDKACFPRVKLCAGWITEKVMRDLAFTPAVESLGTGAYRKEALTVCSFAGLTGALARRANRRYSGPRKLDHRVR
jgi:hypothetical protein